MSKHEDIRIAKLRFNLKQALIRFGDDSGIEDPEEKEGMATMVSIFHIFLQMLGEEQDNEVDNLLRASFKYHDIYTDMRSPGLTLQQYEETAGRLREALKEVLKTIHDIGTVPEFSLTPPSLTIEKEMEDLFGKWPGDETEQQLKEALDKI